ncbi:MAG: T9SS type A sorting domain-containing protein [Salibacteraceae bacterium]
MKRILLGTMLLFLFNFGGFSQCAFNNTPYSSITPTGNWQTFSGGWAGEYQSFTATAGYIYYFSYCSAEGGSGSSTYDTQITIFDASNNSVAYNDDYCGLQSYVAWTCSTSGTYKMQTNVYNCATNTTSATYAYKMACATPFGSSQYPAGTHTATNIPNDLDTISTCNFTDEYAVISLLDGPTYEFASSTTTDYLVLTTPGNVVLEEGVTPISYTSNANQNVRLHILADSCASSSSFACRTTTVLRQPCLATIQYPIGVDTNNTTPVPLEISTCNFAGEYYEIYLDTGEYLFTSSNPNDVFTFTDVNNNFFFSAQTPVTANVTGTPLVVRVHIFSNANCATESVCRTTEVTCLSCPVPAPVVSPQSAEICVGEGPVSLTASNPFGDQTYWYEGACLSTPIDSGTTTQVNPSTTTTYYVANRYDTLYSECDMMTVTVNPLPVITFPTLEDALCNGDDNGMIIAQADSGTAPYAYEWSNGTMTASNSNIGSGEYYVTVTDDNGCVSMDTAAISEPDSLLASLTSQDANCASSEDGNISVNTMGGTMPYNFDWSSGTTGDSISELATGSYVVTITDDNGCMYIDSVMINYINEDPIVEMDSSVILCKGFEVTLDAGSWNAYMWSNNETTQTITVTVEGTYTVEITDANGCKGEASTIVIEDECVGVDEFNQMASITAYPNPTRGELNVTIESKVNSDLTISLIAMDGRMIERREVNLNNNMINEQFNLNGLSAGIYMMQFNIDGNIATKRIILQ